MKRPDFFPVTWETLPQCWPYIDGLRRKARRKSSIAKIGGFLTNLFFLFTLLFLGNGLIYRHLSGPYHRFLDSLGFFTPLWSKVSGLLLKSGDTLAMQILKLLLFAYGVSMLLFAALALIIVLVYHPRNRQMPEGTYADCTAALAQAAEDAWNHSYKTRIHTSIVSTVLVIFAAFFLFFAYVVYLQDAQAAMALLTIFPTADASTNCILYVLGSYLVINFFSSILLFLTRFLYRYDFPYDLMAQAQAANVFASLETWDTPDENTPDRRKEWAAALREDALALEKEAAYGKAKSMLRDAALAGDIPAMEHYARHCLLSHMNDSARYWLKRCMASGEGSQDARKMLTRLKLGLKHKVGYLHKDAQPLTTGMKVRKYTVTVLKILWRTAIVALLIGAVAICVLMFKSNFDPSIFTDLPAAFAKYF